MPVEIFYSRPGLDNSIQFCACSRYKYCLTNNCLVMKLLKSTLRGKTSLDISMTLTAKELGGNSSLQKRRRNPFIYLYIHGNISGVMT